MASWFTHILVALWSALCISTSLTLMVLLFNRKVSLNMARAIWAPGVLWVCGVNWKSPEPIISIFVSNHRSYLDLPGLFSALPVNLHFMAKKQL